MRLLRWSVFKMSLQAPSVMGCVITLFCIERFPFLIPNLTDQICPTVVLLQLLIVICNTALLIHLTGH